MNDKDSTKDKVLEDYTKDVRAYMQTLKGVVTALCVVIVLFIIGLVAVQINNQKMLRDIANHSADKIVEILSEYDWQTEYEVVSTNNELYYGDINIGNKK